MTEEEFLQMMAEEKEITKGFAEWFSGCKSRASGFDRRLSLCAFHAGARWGQSKKIETPATSDQ